MTECNCSPVDVYLAHVDFVSAHFTGRPRVIFVSRSAQRLRIFGGDGSAGGAESVVVR